MSAIAAEDDSLTSGKMDDTIGVTQNQQELRPENFENAMTQSELSAATDELMKQ
jgi:uncharacterized protein involved in tolerance to divalent cations